MEQATRNKLRNVVTQCRRLLEEAVRNELQGRFGVYADAKKDGVVVEDEARMSNLADEDRAYRHDLLDHFEHIKAFGTKPKEALAQLVREVAFTHLNRLCAYKMMEARQVYVGGERFREAVSRGVNSNGVMFYLADHPEEQRLFDTGHQDIAYRHFLDWLGGRLSDEIGILFSPDDPANRLYPPQRVLDDVLALINDDELAGIWSQDEAIGWVYQYFTPKELRDQARKESQAPRNSYELAFRNQFFTPRYVVEFLTDNTLGRIWYEMRKGETALKDSCRYMVRRPGEVFLDKGQAAPEGAEKDRDNLSQKELLKLPVFVPHRPKKDPREIRLLDPAVGSAHFLLYGFDLLLTIYEEAYTDTILSPALQKDYPTPEALRKAVPGLILKHNLHGIDIDLRATQISALALWLRCQRAYQEMGLKRDRPKITRSNIVCAEPMPGEKNMLEEFIGQLEPKLLGQLVEVIFDKMKLAGEAGALLMIEEEIRDAVAEARRQWQAGPIPIQRSFFEDDESRIRQQRFDFSGITDGEFFAQAEAKVVETLRIYAVRANSDEQFHRRLFSEDALRGFSFVDICHKRFDAVVMNPPFGLAPDRAFAYLKHAFPLSYTELLATFVDRSIRLCNGIGGAITSRSFMVATRLQNWRHDILIDRLSTLVDLGASVMDAALVEAAAYTFFSTPAVDRPLIAIDVRNESTREASLAAAITKENSGINTAHRLLPTVFKKFPKFKILYSLPYKIADLLQTPLKFEPSIGTARQGMTTWDDFRFIRLRWEVDPDLIGPCNKWEHLAKGGAYERYYGNVHLLVGWDGDGREMRAANIRVNGTDAQAKQASEYWRRPGNTYSLRSGRGFSARALPSDCLFTSQGPVVFTESTVTNATILGWLNSPLITNIIELQSNAGKFMSGIIKTLPWRNLNCDSLKQAEDDTSNLIIQIRALNALEETSSHFCGLPFHDSISLTTQMIQTDCANVRDRTKAVDFKWNDIVNRAYEVNENDIRRLQELNVFSDDEDPNDVPETEIALDFSKIEICKMLISQFCGTAYGRWDIRFPIHTSGNEELDDPYDPLPAYPPLASRLDRHSDTINAESQITPRDSILVDDPSHSDDIVRRVRYVLEAICKDRADAIEREVCEILGIKELREYFRRPGNGGFWADHVSRYSKSRRKAPIYWLLQSSKKNYALWLYYHRLDKDILFKALNNYVEPKIRLEENGLDSLRAQKQAAGEPSKGSKKLDKEIERQEEFVSELRDFAEKLGRAARLDFGDTETLDSSVTYDPDLNDGVVLNIAPLHELVPWKEAKTYWDALLKGEYEWSSMGQRLRAKGLVP